MPRHRADFSGPEATTVNELAPYTGARAEDRVEGCDRRRAVRLNYVQLGINYGDNVDFQLRDRQVLLCPQTRGVLYHGFTAERVRYVPGTRPALERVVTELTSGARREETKALALMRFCRDLYKRSDGDPDRYIYGGTEEQLIEKGEELCECLGRLYVALCEIAAIPARIVMHDIGGHIASEVLIEGRWAYVDPRCGVYAKAPDGYLASTWELWHHPEWLRHQPREVTREVSARWTWEQRVVACERKYFHPKEVNGFQNYSLMDADDYGYEQLTCDEAAGRGLFLINEVYRNTAARVFGL